MSSLILVVDPDPATRKATAALLKGDGRRIITADGADTAAAIIREQPVDLLVTEVRLKGYNGLHLLAMAPTPLRAVVVTGFADAAIEADARRFGADYIVRPVTGPELNAAVERQFAREGDLFFEARRSPRVPVPGPVVVQLDGRPARVRDVSDGGACVELSEAPSASVTGPSILVHEQLSVPVYIAWERPLASDSWLCGLQAAADFTAQWQQVAGMLLRTPTSERQERR